MLKYLFSSSDCVVAKLILVKIVDTVVTTAEIVEDTLNVIMEVFTVVTAIR